MFIIYLRLLFIYVPRATGRQGMQSKQLLVQEERHGAPPQLAYPPKQTELHCPGRQLEQSGAISRLKPGTHLTDARKTKSAGRRGNIGPSARLVILELTEPTDRPAVARPMLRFFERTQPADFIS